MAPEQTVFGRFIWHVADNEAVYRGLREREVGHKLERTTAARRGWGWDIDRPD